jgi:amidase
MEAQHAAPDQPVLDVVASVSFTAFGNVSGLPSVSLPLHWTDTREGTPHVGEQASEQLPVGVQLTGGPWQDGALIALAAQLEEMRPWATRLAPIAVA